MFNVATSRAPEFERELASTKAGLNAAKTLHTKFGAKITDLVTAFASVVVLLIMTTTAVFTVVINVVKLVAETMITIVAWLEFFSVSMITLFDVVFVKCAAIYTFVCTTFRNEPCGVISPPPPSPVPSPPPSPPDTSSHTSIIPWKLDVCDEVSPKWICTPYSSKEEKRTARITRRALRAYIF
jgi:hypothetical protein